MISASTLIRDLNTKSFTYEQNLWFTFVWVKFIFLVLQYTGLLLLKYNIRHDKPYAAKKFFYILKICIQTLIVNKLTHLSSCASDGARKGHPQIVFKSFCFGDFF